jgi:hypothetical protein
MTKEFRENKLKYCMHCLQNRSLPYCNKEEMLPGCPWAELDDVPERCDEEMGGMITCSCCGKKKYIPDRSIWVYKRIHTHKGNAYTVDYYCTYTCWRKEEREREARRRKKLRSCA